LLCGLAVALGAFGAHALRGELESAGQLENWRTAVRYQMWHGLALIALGQLESRSAVTFWAFTVGTLLFGGSIYGLALGGPSSVLGPITPLGGTALLIGWGAAAIGAWRSRT
ncbi:MAG: DUF423 domain-containing protein, partial [Planctomycetota bacterium]